MTPYFESAEHRAKLVAEAAAWTGTPFRAGAAVRGAGVDCVCLAAEIMVACGLIEGYDFPRYTLQWAKHRDDSLVLPWLDGCPRFVRLPDGEPPRIGDVLCFQIGRCVHHVAVALELPLFIHAVEDVGVKVCQLNDPTYAKRLACIYRPVVLSR